MELMALLRFIYIPFLIVPVMVLFEVVPTSRNREVLAGSNSARHGTRQPGKRALLVGISDYCRGINTKQCRSGSRYFWNLNSNSDVGAVKQVLIDKFGFHEGDIKVLTTPSETTHKSIVSTFQSFLIDQTERGDIIYFHYSGHGGQVPDDLSHGPNLKVGDELDGLDETLIPSDYVSQKDRSNDIRDDEIELLLQRLKRKQPANATFSFDSCFSGTISRGGRRLVRGKRWDGSQPVYTNSRGVPDGPTGLFPENAAENLGFVVISASRNDQVAIEAEDEITHQSMGMLTYALVKTFRNAGPETTYRDVFEQINDEVTRTVRDQNPQIEGNIDLKLMSGISLSPEPYIKVSVELGTVVLKAGSLHGMTPGSQFAIYRSGANPKFISPIAFAEIASVDSINSVLKLTSEPDINLIENLRTARAVETEHRFGNGRLTVLTADLASNGRSHLIDEIQELGLVSITQNESDPWDIRLCSGRCREEKLVRGVDRLKKINVITLQRPDGSIIERVDDGVNASSAIKKHLEGEWRWRFVKSLENKNPNISIKLRLVPVAIIERDPITKRVLSTKDITPELTPKRGKDLVLHIGEYYRLELLNRGNEDSYVTVLDLQGDGTIAPLWPHPFFSVGGSDENKIPADNTWHRIPLPYVIEITEPIGPEVFKAVATVMPTNYAPLFSSRKLADTRRSKTSASELGAKEAFPSLGELLIAAATGEKNTAPIGRGLQIQASSEIAVPTADWATASLVFEVQVKRRQKGMRRKN